MMRLRFSAIAGLALSGLLAVMPLFLSRPGLSATWQVSKDGTGDFSIIQEAADAAADGDTILIGPGRFDDSQALESSGDLRVLLDGSKSLCFIGAGVDETIIGPETFVDGAEHWGIWNQEGSTQMVFEGITFENLDEGGVYSQGDELLVSHCVFSRCGGPLTSLSPNRTVILDSRFVDIMGAWDVAILCRSSISVIGNVVFERCRSAIQLDYYGSSSQLVQECVFDGQGVGLEGIFFDRCGGEVRNNVFKDCVAVGVGIDGGWTVNIEGNTFENILGSDVFTGRAVILAGVRDLTMTGNTISNCEVGIDLIGPGVEYSIQGNHIFRTEGSNQLFVRTSIYWHLYEYTWDLSNNYWGTTDPDEISLWINDASDADNNGILYVNFLPVADGPVPTEQKSLGGLRSMFR